MTEKEIQLLIKFLKITSEVKGETEHPALKLRSELERKFNTDK